MQPIPIERLPASPRTEVRPLLTDGPADSGYAECGPVRLRRSPGCVHLEMQDSEGGWLQWYVSELNETHAYGMVSLADRMSLACTLATKEAGTESAAFVDRYAARTAALVRFSTTRIDGLPVVFLHLPVTLEEKHALILVALTGPLGSTVDEPWLERAESVLRVGGEIYHECYQLHERFEAVDPATRQRMLDAPSTERAGAMDSGVRLIGGTAGLAESVLGILKNLGMA